MDMMDALRVGAPARQPLQVQAHRATSGKTPAEQSPSASPWLSGRSPAVSAGRGRCSPASLSNRRPRPPRLERPCTARRPTAGCSWLRHCPPRVEIVAEALPAKIRCETASAESGSGWRSLAVGAAQHQLRLVTQGSCHVLIGAQQQTRPASLARLHCGACGHRDHHSPRGGFIKRITNGTAKQRADSAPATAVCGRIGCAAGWVPQPPGKRPSRLRKQAPRKPHQREQQCAAGQSVSLEPRAGSHCTCARCGCALGLLRVQRSRLRCHRQSRAAGRHCWEDAAARALWYVGARGCAKRREHAIFALSSAARVVICACSS